VLKPDPFNHGLDVLIQTLLRRLMLILSKGSLLLSRL